MKKIVVVMGGPSTEAEVSRRSGTAILNALKSKGYNAEGMELVPETFPQQIKESGADFVFNALHGKFGEDGIIQGRVTHLIFKGVHYEMEVQARGYEWLVHSTDMVAVGKEVGIRVDPFDIQIMNKPESEDEEAVPVEE